MKKINLITNLYIDKNAERQKELELCLKNNIENPLIDFIHAFATPKERDYYIEKFKCDKLFVWALTERPTYNAYFWLTREAKYVVQDAINIISNTDIYFNETLQLVKEFYQKEDNAKTCLATCRWDLQPNGEIAHYDHCDSQDFWSFAGSVQKMEGADFTCGKRGCDNSIAHIISQNGYNVINPSIDVQSIHVHNSAIRNYDVNNPDSLIPPPYLTIHPSKLP